MSRHVKNLFACTLGDYHAWTEKNQVKVVAASKAAVALLRYMGIRTTSYRMPKGFLQATKETQAGFIAGVLESSYQKIVPNGISFRFIRRQIAQELQVLLANYGIFCTLQRRVKKLGWYELTISGKKNITLAHEAFFRGSAILENKHLMVTYEDTEPELPGFREFLPQLLKECLLSFRAQTLITGLIPEKGTPAKDRPKVTESKIRELHGIIESLNIQGPISDKIRRFFASGYVLDPVKTLKNEFADVYDLNVPEGESFVAGAMTNHNTFISSCIAAYETYKLIMKGHPQTYYGMPSAKVIQLIVIATDKKQASNLYGDVSGHFRESTVFAPYLANNTQSYARLQTPYDIQKHGKYSDNKAAPASLQITFSPCKAKAVRGFANIVLIMDEMAHFGEAGQSSAEEIYTAAEPSLATFQPKVDNVSVGPLESKIISISSPMGRAGKFYDLYRAGFNGGFLGERMLCIQAPTWEVNPTISRDIFETAYERDPVTFFTEYGAEFTDRSRGWLSDKSDLLTCVNPSLKRATRGVPNLTYYAGFDLGLAGDSSAIAIGHVEMVGKSPKIVVDVVDSIQAGKGLYHDQDRLEFDDVADWVLDYTRRFRIVDGIFDQHTGIPFEQALIKRGISHFRKEFFKPQLTSDIFKNFKDLLWDQALQFYNAPLEENQELCDYLAELLTLQQNVRSKSIVLVEAPRADGYHDDRSDALVRMVWLASKNLTNPKIIVGHTPNLSALTGGRSIRNYSGGSNPMRRLPPKRKR
jgi:hypothetical protein